MSLGPASGDIGEPNAADVTAWLAQACDLQPTAVSTVSFVVTSWQDWCALRGCYASSWPLLAQALIARGCSMTKSPGEDAVAGISIKVRQWS